MYAQVLPVHPRVQAAEQFDVLYRQARLRSLWSRLTHQSQQLLCLSQIRAQLRGMARRQGCTRRVPLKEIRGSVNRCGDFDAAFRPLHLHIRERWIAIALATQTEVDLPAVELVCVNDTYFVVDGHHRISVAKTKGLVTINAHVIEWQVASNPPCAPLCEQTYALTSRAWRTSPAGWRAALGASVAAWRLP